MAIQRAFRRATVVLWSIALASLALRVGGAQQAPTQFGGAYSGLEPRRQQLVDQWVARFTEATGQKLEAGPFYDEIVSLSGKTTFDAVTHALMRTQLTDSSGATLGDALALVERVEAVKGEIAGARGDRQFRLYARLEEGALDTLARAREFERGPDNSIYHKGYPINYRQQGGTPSIQISVAPDGRRADIDVDYRSASFPAAIFNGHLSASNSDVRAGDNSARHSGRWTGFQIWWRSFFGRMTRGSENAAAREGALALLKAPRAGNKTIDVMVHDFLTAWLVEGNVVAATSYVSERAYACLAQDAEDPTNFDRGLAPFQLMIGLKAAYDALPRRESLEGLAVGIRLPRPELKLVSQPHHAQFVLYSVPDDVAAAFDCESRLTLDDPTKIRRAYGNYFGAVFYVSGERDQPVALLWGRQEGFWKIVSWRAGAEETETPAPAPPPDIKVSRIKADASLVQAARAFLESWLIRQDYDAAFGYLSTKAYGCYDLERSADQPASTSADDAGRRIREGLERSGNRFGKQRTLEALLSSAEPTHPAIRVMDHPYSRTFSLAGVPTSVADAFDCATRARGKRVQMDGPLEYGTAFGMTVRFRTRSGEAPVLRTLWRRENDAWRIAAYGVELP